MVNISKPVIICSVIGTGFAGAIMIKEHFGGKKYEEKNEADGKVVIITGANTGIGRETALELAKRKAKVIMACRDIKRCEEAREDIVLQSKNKYVYCRLCDLASQSSVRKFAERFKTEHQRLDVLINNAGVMRCPLSKTEEGIEMQLGVNHMGHFLLTNLLLDRLKESAPSRIVNLSSTAHKRGKINKEDLNSDKKYDSGEAYNQSKLANVLFTRELSRRLEGIGVTMATLLTSPADTEITRHMSFFNSYIAAVMIKPFMWMFIKTYQSHRSGVTVNAVHPGIVDTEITRHMSFFNSYIAAVMIKPFMWMFIKNPRQGAQTVLYASLSPDLEKVSGKYFSDCSEAQVSPEAQDDTTARWLWLVSEKWTRLVVKPIT